MNEEYCSQLNELRTKIIGGTDFSPEQLKVIDTGKSLLDSLNMLSESIKWTIKKIQSNLSLLDDYSITWDDRNKIELELSELNGRLSSDVSTCEKIKSKISELMKSGIRAFET